MEQTLTPDEITAVRALCALRGPTNRALRMLDDWNGAGRMLRGTGISTTRSRSRARILHAQVTSGQHHDGAHEKTCREGDHHLPQGAARGT